MPKKIAPLSENKINTAKNIEKAYRIFDGGGLFLLVTTDGGKWWRFKYCFKGKEKMLSFGVYPEVSLNDARSSRDAARELLKQGIDPSVLRKEEKERRKAERLESERTPSVRVTIDGKIEIWKGSNIMRLSWDEARFIATLLNNIVR
ncbi:MAG: Arm DNA-binding domain-containing protein [Syntrophales bacterium]|jgi:hypothetical protein